MISNSSESPVAQDMEFKGTQDAFDAIYRQHAEAAYKLALQLTGNCALAEDSFQEAMFKIWRAAPLLRPGNARGWISRIVTRECIRTLKARRAERNRINCVQAFCRRNTTCVPNSEGLEHNRRLSIVADVLTRLPATEQDLLKLHFQSGLSQRKISAVVALPQQTVSIRLKRIIHALRREFGVTNC